MQHSINRLFEKLSLNVLGLMSGTSCDGLDIALVRISGSGSETLPEPLQSLSLPYTEEQHSFILDIIGRSAPSLSDLSQLNFYLAQLWAEMVEIFFRQTGIDPAEVDLIGSHGQTIWHEPVPRYFQDRQVASTWQIGDPSVLANRLNIPVVGDFRVADVALGGQGAPLIPYFDWVHFSRFKKNMLILNIGGISNITFVPADGAFEKVIAFDTGPGNMLMDQAAEILFNTPYDPDGSYAAGGNPDIALFGFVENTDGFPYNVPPKSTGREHYGREFLRPVLKFAEERNTKPADVMSTLTYYTARSIALNYRKFIEPESVVETVAVGGGGARNPVLMEELQKAFGEIPVLPVGQFGVDEDFKEAIGFAVLASETVRGMTSSVPRVTGAGRAAVLGKICMV